MELSRRGFLKKTGAAAALLVSLPGISACSGLKREDLGRLDDQDKISARLGKEEIEILYLASLAPSSHNTQPWLVRIVEPRHWIIGLDLDRRLPAVDPENRELLLSLGAFLENLILAARVFGYRADISLLAKTPQDQEVIDVRLRKERAQAYPLERIRKRRTVRNGFLNEPLKAEDLKFITGHDDRACGLMPAVSGGFPRHAFFFPNDTPQTRFLREGTIAANRSQAFREAAQKELADWIRWSGKEGRKYRNGLTPESMEITGLAGLYVRTFFDHQSVMEKSFRDRTLDTVAAQVKAGAGWLVVTSPDSALSTLIAYGMVFENILLRTRERGIAVHPMTQMLEEEAWKKQAARELGLPGQVQWILRLGYLKTYPDPVSLRRPVFWFVKSA